MLLKGSPSLKHQESFIQTAVIRKQAYCVGSVRGSAARLPVTELVREHNGGGRVKWGKT